MVFAAELEETFKVVEFFGTFLSKVKDGLLFLTMKWIPAAPERFAKPPHYSKECRKPHSNY